MFGSREKSIEKYVFAFFEKKLKKKLANDSRDFEGLAALNNFYKNPF